jgi:hypothetical protein
MAFPALIPLARSFVDAHLQHKVATGFIFYDMAYYMAYAREQFDQGFHLTFGNPYAPYGTPAIYFQPQALVLGGLQRMGLDPGLVYNLFGLAAMFFAAWVAVRFYEEVVGVETPAKLIGLVCFFWGGGILSLAGIAAGFIEHQPILDSILKFDISGGWWMFNFGRNLSYPVEAYYHGVFLLTLLCLIRGRLGASLALAALLSLSHPITGVELLLILVAYSALELALKSRAVTPLFLAVSIAILVFHVGYYLVFLNRFPDHRVLQSQWDVAWFYAPSTYVPALFIVGCLAAARLLGAPGPMQAMKDSRVRLFAVWFLVVFALTQHNLVIKPMEPVHFARGYDWMALFFMGAPALLASIDRLLGIRPRQLQHAAITALVLFFLLDNLIWYASFLSPGRKSQAILLTYDQKSVLDWLDRNTAPPDMVVCQDSMVSYLVSTYTRVRSWEGHAMLTPFYAQRAAEIDRAFGAGHILPEWERLRVYYVAELGNNWSPPSNTAELYQNGEFVVWGPK